MVFVIRFQYMKIYIKPISDCRQLITKYFNLK